MIAVFTINYMNNISDETVWVKILQIYLSLVDKDNVFDDFNIKQMNYVRIFETLLIIVKVNRQFLIDAD